MYNNLLFIGIEEAKNEALNLNETLRILVVKTPTINIHSSNIQAGLLQKHLDNFPIMLPKKIWAQSKNIYFFINLLLLTNVINFRSP